MRRLDQQPSRAPAAANCVYLIRAEERYGNGDHVYTVDEQTNAINALYDAGRGDAGAHRAGPSRPAGHRDQLLIRYNPDRPLPPACIGRPGVVRGGCLLSKEDGMRFSRCQR